MKRTVLALLTLVLTSQWAFAQQPLPCGTDQERARLIAEDPGYLARETEFLQELNNLISNSAVQRDDDQVYRIPLVFHILHQRGAENITNEQIIDQVNILNRDYAKMNADTSQVHASFAGNIGKMDIEFRLATIDNVGQCTNGIIRHRSVETFRGESTSKLKPWPRDQYMNIWVCDGILSGAAGYFTPGGWSVLDGIMILHNYVGSIGTSAGFSSRALTHEVGHYLSLAHIWGSNNGVPDPNTPTWAMQAACGDDGVEDTPFTRGWNYCAPTVNSTRSWADCEHQKYEWVTYFFDDVTTNSGTIDPSPMVAARDTATNAVTVDLAPFSAHGVSANSAVDANFAFSDWDTGAPDGATQFSELTGSINTGKYYEFTLSPKVTHMTAIDSFSFKWKRNDTGARTFAVRSSVNNYATNLPLRSVGAGWVSIQAGNIGFYTEDATEQQFFVVVDPPVAGYVDLIAPVTFRIYAWNAEDASGTFEMDEVKLGGDFGKIENVQNYMEYSYCSHMFTNGQRERARAALNSPTYARDELWTDENLQATGVADGFEVHCAPVADFYAQVGTDPANVASPFPAMSCANTNVRFVDNSSRAFPTEWSWTFQDGTPSTSTQRNPIVQFSSPGDKAVTLTVSNAQGSSSKTDEYAVRIGDASVAYSPYLEGFEYPALGDDPYPYTRENYEANFSDFDRFNGGGFESMGCVMLNSADREPFDLIDPDNAGDIDDLISPIFNLVGAERRLSFRYAYSSTTNVLADVTETLVVEYSTTCGGTWVPLPQGATITGVELLTNGNSTLVPPQEWKTKTFVNIPTSIMGPTTRFRWRFTSSEFSGNLFIDDIFVGMAVGIEDLMRDGFISVYPNPTNDHFTLQVYGMESASTEITITDLRGAQVYRDVFQPRDGAPIEISGRGIGLAEGMYLLRASNVKGSSVQKLIVGR